MERESHASQKTSKGSHEELSQLLMRRVLEKAAAKNEAWHLLSQRRIAKERLNWSVIKHGGSRPLLAEITARG